MGLLGKRCPTLPLTALVPVPLLSEPSLVNIRIWKLDAPHLPWQIPPSALGLVVALLLAALLLVPLPIPGMGPGPVVVVLPPVVLCLVCILLLIPTPRPITALTHVDLRIAIAVLPVDDLRRRCAHARVVIPIV